jgi:serine/threonine protein kinase/Tol biopolymer transport system component
VALSPGFRIGVYEVETLIGVGGMGEVYRARDTQLGRPVAIKVLPDTFANDPERRARFEREAQTLAALNHPNIAVIHGFESRHGTHALVMEFVEGPTLADRIAEGPIAIDEALPIARQVAVALEAAHEQGIIHRDLKPANIKVRPDGTVKVLDFGLAKAVATDTSLVRSPQSPTITSPAGVTGANAVLGTPAYMSPEQARGRVVDKRTDIWAFGCLVYEMLTGHAVFKGESAADTLATVVATEADLQALPHQTPTAVHHLLLRCLTKDPVRRLRDIGEARIVLDGGQAAQTTQSTAAKRTTRVPSSLIMTGAAVAIAIVAGFTLWQLRYAGSESDSATSAMTRRSVIPLRGAPTRGGSLIAALSADGTVVVYGATLRDTGGELHARRLDVLDSYPIQGTGGADVPFLSHDGKRLGFNREGDIWIVPIAGGASTRVARSASPDSKPAWLRDGRIVFTTASGELQIVQPESGAIEPLTQPGTGEWHMSPVGLPDDRHVLFTAIVSGANQPRIELVSLNDRTRRKIVDEAATTPQIVDELLLYSRLDGALVAVPFDTARGVVSGSVRPLPDRVSRSRFGVAQYAAARGVLVYVGVARNQLVEVNREGIVEVLAFDERSWHHPRYAPDGTRIVADLTTAGDNDRDIWVLHRDTSTLSRVTRIGDAHDPAWLPDSRQVSFFSFRSKDGPLMIAPADGGSEPQPVRITSGFTASDLINPGGWLRDGSTFIGGVRGTAGTGDLWRIPRQGSPALLVGSGFDEMAGTVSSDGRWLAYQSNETGRMEIYVRPFDGGEGRIQVSNGGATDPVWDRKADVVYYIETNGERRDLMAATLRRRPVGIVRRDAILRDMRIAQARNHANFDVHPDGSLFVMPVITGARELITVFNWAASVRGTAVISH